jgi:Second Longin domain of FUZ, MON1 and HPS1/First Longin domain of FUZ, MON1 and HPS1
MTNSGKPFFCRFEHGYESRVCGMVQALMATSTASDLGTMKSLSSPSTSFLFLTVGEITLMGIIARKDEQRTSDGHLFMRLRLEYLYCQILFTMTQQVHSILCRNPNYDISDALENSEVNMRSLIDDSEGQKAGYILTGAIEAICPITNELRKITSMALLHATQDTPDTIFALLLAGEKLLSIVQPSTLSLQLSTSDLRILIKFINSQPALKTSELWTPVCLPRFNADGFLYAYISYLDLDSGLILVLISQISETSQFDLSRKASFDVKRSIGIPVPIGSVLRINKGNTDTDVMWTRELLEVQWPSDDQDQKIEFASSQPSNESDCALLQEIRLANDPEYIMELFDEYISLGNVQHFLFRKDVQILGHSTIDCGELPQCFCPPLDFPLADCEDTQYVWSAYEKLSLRMRGESLNSALTLGIHCESHDSTVSNKPQEPDSIPALNHVLLAMKLVESIPDTNGISYINDGKFLFLAMNGKSFELYCTFPASIQVNDATSAASLLAKSLVADSGKLFLLEPLTWK